MTLLMDYSFVIGESIVKLESLRKKDSKLANDTQVSVKPIYIDKITGHAIFYLMTQVVRL